MGQHCTVRDKSGKRPRNELEDVTFLSNLLSKSCQVARDNQFATSNHVGLDEAVTSVFD